ncbi:MAG: hypothetical protein KKD18_02600 [Nanoarchaeota archaeon]|nr:hypothetical protein [Nanoarchaeota archaeon]
MRLGMTKEIDWAYVGALLANSDKHAQTTFFREFVKECKSWGTSYQVGIQLAYINGGLTDEEKEVLSGITYKEGD